jgi:hypothetical protein
MKLFVWYFAKLLSHIYQFMHYLVTNWHIVVTYDYVLVYCWIKNNLFVTFMYAIIDANLAHY